MSDSKKPTVREIEARYEPMYAGDIDIAYLVGLVKRMGEALSRVEKQFGWHGHGSKDRGIFYCENCGESHKDWAQIPHTQACPISEAHELLKEIEL